MQREAWTIKKKGNWRVEVEMENRSFYVTNTFTGDYIEFGSKEAAENFIKNHSKLKLSDKNK